MKKCILLLSFLMCTFINAQVHIGEQAGSSTNYGPVNAYYGYSYIQNIYKASDINASGEITALTFEMTNENVIDSSDDNIDVWIGHTTKQAFESDEDWVDVSTLTQVLTNGTITKEGATVTITFETPFNYNGTDNLILAYDANEDGYNASLDKFYYSTNSDNQAVTIYYRNDSSNPDPTEAPNATDRSSRYPDITFIGITQTCPAPTNLTATDITTTTATLGWTESGSATMWNIEYGPSGFTLGEGTTVSDLTSNSYQLESLTNGTAYSFYVRSKCGTDDLSSWTGPFTFNTIAENVTPPYTTSFEDGTPAGWTTEVLSGNEWGSYDSASNSHTGNKCVRYRYNTSQAADSWLFTIGFVLEAGKEYDVSFYQKIGLSSYPENLKLTVGTEANATAQTTTLLDLPEVNNVNYERRRTMFTPNADGVYFFGLQAYSATNQYTILVDDFSVKENTVFSVHESNVGNYWFSSQDWADYDNDGDVDLLISGALPTNSDPYNAGPSTTHVYNNDGTGNMTLNESIVLQGVHTGDPKWIDYDQDGDLDIAVFGMSYADGTNLYHLYRNDNGTFTSVDSNTQGASFSNAQVGDYDNDGDLDMIVTGYTTYNTTIFKNTGNGFETENISSTVPGAFNGRVNWADIDNDMDLDIVIAGTTQGGTSTLRIYTNNAGVYAEAQTISTYNTYSRSVLGDYDNDGDLDIAVMALDNNSDNFVEILTNNNGTFEHVADLTGVSVSGAAAPLQFGDYDNDGDLDLIVNGTDSDYNGKVILYKNDNGTFTPVQNTGFSPVGGYSLSWQDIDGDMDIDILISGLYDDPNNSQYYGTNRLYKNETSEQNTKPQAPTELNSTVENGVVTFNWSGANDTQTGSEGLQYHITVGTTSGGADIAHYSVHGNQWMLQNLPENTETLYWCVKSMDTSFIMSECSEMQTVSNLGTNDMTSTVEGIKLYPNPVKDGVVHLSTNDLQGEDVQVFIYSVTGKLLFAEKYNKVRSEMAIPVKGFTTGNYFLTYKVGKETKSIQFIVK